MENLNNMLHIHHSNRLENLASALLSSYTDQEASPFTPRIIITESKPLSRWLEQQFCHHDGIRCLIDMPMPAEWIWSLARKTLGLPPGDNPLTRERIQWLINDALTDRKLLAKTDDGEQIKHYLKGDKTGLKRWQLAGRIGDCFDRYQYYRPKMIQEWGNGQEKHWQAALWQEISRNTEAHQVQLMTQFLEALPGVKDTSALPDRLDLFSIHNLPPLILQAYTELAQHIPVNIWLLSPTPEYWADLLTPRQDALMRIEKPEEAALSQKGCPLLVQWGRQGQELQDMLLTRDMEIAQESEKFIEPARDSLLGNVQADIYEAVDQDTEAENISDETPLPSIQVDICHNPMRECQVLHDTLLHSLKADKTLQPEDILVMAPEVSRYAPYINAVFGRPPAPGEPRLPFNLNDVLLADEHPLLRAFLDLLHLPESRFTRADVMGLANIPEVRKNFDLQETDTTWLVELFDQLRIFWGLDASDKDTRFDLPAINDNTWQQAFERCMAGYAFGVDELYQHNEKIVAPQTGMDSQNAERAARFFTLLDTLRNWMQRLKPEATSSDWANRLGNLLEDIFGEAPDEEKRLDTIRQALSDLQKTTADSKTPISLNVIRHWLTNNLTTRTDRSRPFSGGITFCAMRPQRGLPFKVICLLGMQERAFPRQQSTLEFDLMARNRKHGDPDYTKEDRYLFLEALLATRQKLIISYTGRHLRTNKDLQPSVLVQELLDHLDARYHMNNKPVSKIIQKVHPLQPFSIANFNNPKLPGFDRRWQITARALHSHQSPSLEKEWPTFSIELPDEFIRQVSPSELGNFLKKPLRKFIQQRLRLYEPRDIELKEDEPLQLDHLEQWSARDRLIRSRLQGKAEEGRQRLIAQSLLPHGTPGEQLLQAIDGETEEILRQHNLTDPLEPETVDIDLDFATSDNRWQMSGRLQSVYKDTGLLQVSASKYKIINLLPLWVEHLCLHASAHSLAGTARFICRDNAYSLNSLDSEHAHDLLQELITIHECGLITPLPIVPSTSSAWFEKWSSNQNTDTATRDAIFKWNGNQNIEGEKENFETKLILRGNTWQPDNELGEWAQRIFTPLSEHITPLL